MVRLPHPSVGYDVNKNFEIETKDVSAHFGPEIDYGAATPTASTYVIGKSTVEMTWLVDNADTLYQRTIIAKCFIYRAAMLPLGKYLTNRRQVHFHGHPKKGGGVQHDTKRLCLICAFCT